MIRRVIIASVLIMLTLAAPAYAHGGPIKLDVHGDGGQGVNATVIYQQDGHPVTGQVDLSYVAVSGDDGRTVGPIRMVASAEGQSFYVGEQPLPQGNWTVTVTATRPSAAQATVSVTSSALPAQAPAPAPSEGTNLVLIASPIALVVVLFGVALLLRHRRGARPRVT
jgi:hypothetical protein